MRLQIGDRAPYAPGQVVVDLIRKQRQSGTLKSVDYGLLERLGVTESLRPRTMASLKQLGLTDDDGNITPVMDAFKKGSEAEYRQYLADHLRTVYGEVFDLVGDPAKASPEAIDDAFRGYEPHGQRSRMVVLFMSLAQEAGLVEEVMRDRASGVGRATTRTKVIRTARARSAVDVNGRDPASDLAAELETPRPVRALPPETDPLIAAYFAKLPPGGTPWPAASREKYLAALGSIFEIVYEEGEGS